MTKLQTAWAILGTIGGIGVLLIISGVLIKVARIKKIHSCTHKTNGVVIKHRFPGSGHLYPIVEYKVDGKSYQARKKYAGVKTTSTSLPIPAQTEVYEDEKGWLHIKTGAIARFREVAERIWPINSVMTVYYNPQNPKKSYVDRPIPGGFETFLFILMGIFLIMVGVLFFFLVR